jgi:hypothetical protein
MLTKLWSRLRNRWSRRQGGPLITPPTVSPAGRPGSQTARDRKVMGAIWALYVGVQMMPAARSET